MTVNSNQQAGWFNRNAWRFVVAAESALAGAAVAAVTALMISFGGPSDLTDLAFFACLGAAGGFPGGLLLAGGFGRAGGRGWVLATLTAFCAPPLAGALAGTVLQPGLGTYWGGALALSTFLFPPSLAVWGLCLALIHLHARRLRAGLTAAQARLQTR